MEILLSLILIIVLTGAILFIVSGGHPLTFLRTTGERLSVLDANRGPLLYMLIAITLTVVFLFLIYIYPTPFLGAEQPIPFSHRLHAGVKKIDCRFCHPYVARSTFPGIPPVEKCLFCHNYIIANHPQIQKEHYYFDTGTPTPWVKVNYVPEHVMFNHQRHIRKKIDCRECHGAVETMDRIAGKRFRMGFCLECHHKRNANVGCWLACHN